MVVNWDLAVSKGIPFWGAKMLDVRKREEKSLVRGKYPLFET